MMWRDEETMRGKECRNVEPAINEHKNGVSFVKWHKCSGNSCAHWVDNPDRLNSGCCAKECAR